ncbi:WD40 repeat domain-containing protein [Fibrella forsythiae]|uniref:WD40 repeat domain-containing protein n=1 Tax=Fibrella forsythiae TaxID=2817061 RepID=A0ABS3JDD0_9BACT|nr:WD40 repeat domain-containing protein [Fibrella forsythiae]MBO0948005.1 WD40 repeat domain-containing protein [Fibrella forsythiae]
MPTPAPLKIQRLDTFGGHRDSVFALMASLQPGHFYSAGADGQVADWDVDHPDLGSLVARIPASVYALAIDPASGVLWVGQNYEGIQFIDPAQKMAVGSLQLTTGAIFDIQIYQQTAFVALGDGVVVVLDVPTRAVRKHLKASAQSARCVAINPVEREVAVGYSDNQIRVFDLHTFVLKRTLSGPANSVFTVAYSPDFRHLLAGGRDAHLRSWDVEADYQPQADIVAHMYALNHMAFSPGGHWLATVSMDKTIKLWDADTLRLRKVIDRARHGGHSTSINKVLWLSGTTFATASDDRTVAVWEVIG